MVARHALVTVAAIAIATSCVGGTITPSPSPAPSATPTAEPSVAAASLSPSPSPSPTLTALPTATVRATPTYPPPAADAAAGIGTIRSVRSAGITADGSRVVGVISTDLVTGRIVPLAPVVLASPGALLMRSTAEDEKGPDAWLHAAVLPP